MGLRSYAHKDPLDEFKREAFKLFEDLLNKIKIAIITFLNNIEIVPREKVISRNSNINNRNLENNPKCLLIIKKNEITNGVSIFDLVLQTKLASSKS